MDTQEPPKKQDSLWDIIKFAALALLIVIPVRMFIAQPFVVSGLSMFPTFHNADYLIIDELSYRFTEPHRGDVIVFKYPKDPSKFFIKRIIGLPNETISINGSKVTIKNEANPEGFSLDEQYVQNTAQNNLTTTTGPTEYFVLGDNRSGSSDSRVWGNLDRSYIIGRAYLRLLPLSLINYLPGKEPFTK